MSHVSTWEAPPHRKNRIVDRAGLVLTVLPYAEGDAVVPAPRADATKNVRRFTLLMNLPTKQFREIIGPHLSYPGMHCLCQHSGSIRGHDRNIPGGLAKTDDCVRLDAVRKRSVPGSMKLRRMCDGFPICLFIRSHHILPVFSCLCFPNGTCSLHLIDQELQGARRLKHGFTS